MSTAEAIRHDLDAHRHELAQTVDALASRLDVRARLKERLRSLAKPAAGLAVLLVVGVIVKRRFTGSP